MKVIAWNCQGAFRNKFQEIIDLKPDVLVITECEPLEKLRLGELFPMPTSYFWYSDTGKKGVAVFSFCDLTIEVLNIYNTNFRYFIPFRVYNSQASFFLFAIWAMDHPTDPLSRYIGQVWNAINFYKPLLKQNCLLIGDFNSNKIWDYKERSGNHTSVVDLLADYRIRSLYHLYSGELQGEELKPTFYLHRKEEKSYHIDYAFASDDLHKNRCKIEIGCYQDWIEKSDHMPFIVELSTEVNNVDKAVTFRSFIYQVIDCYSVKFREKFDDECQKLLVLADTVDKGLVNSKKMYELLEKLNKIELLFNELDLGG